VKVKAGVTRLRGRYLPEQINPQKKEKRSRARGNDDSGCEGVDREKKRI